MKESGMFIQTGMTHNQCMVKGQPQPPLQSTIGLTLGGWRSHFLPWVHSDITGGGDWNQMIRRCSSLQEARWVGSYATVWLAGWLTRCCAGWRRYGGCVPWSHPCPTALIYRVSLPHNLSSSQSPRAWVCPVYVWYGIVQESEEYHTEQA